MEEKTDAGRRSLVRRIVALLTGTAGKDLQIDWQLTVAMRRHSPRGGQKKLSAQVRISTRRWYSVRWVAPQLIGVEDD